MRDRLTIVKQKIFVRENPTLMSITKDELRKLYNEVFDRLQEYEVAEEQGQIIVPPCKVGQTVYVVSQGQGFNMRWDIYEGKVTDVHINRHNELEIRAENGEKFFGYYKPCFVFLTKEEAEQALKGGEENENN